MRKHIVWVGLIEVIQINKVVRPAGERTVEGTKSSKIGVERSKSPSNVPTICKSHVEISCYEVKSGWGSRKRNLRPNFIVSIDRRMLRARTPNAKEGIFGGNYFSWAAPRAPNQKTMLIGRMASKNKMIKFTMAARLSAVGWSHASPPNSWK